MQQTEINEAQLIVYRRWRQFGLSHADAATHAMLFARRVASSLSHMGDDHAATIHPPTHARTRPMVALNYDGIHRFDHACEREEKATIEATRKSSEAFARALARQVRRGRETVAVGTFVDPTPPLGALRIRAASPMASACGSPAAMCTE